MTWYYTPSDERYLEAKAAVRDLEVSEPARTGESASERAARIWKLVEQAAKGGAA
jgi:hypothetical protein